MKPAWTNEELEAMKALLLAEIGETEREYPNVRPLPPMSEEEGLEMLLALVETARVRVLGAEEAAIFGQLLSVYRMAVRANTLGYRGRFFVMSEEDVKRLTGKGGEKLQ